MTIPNILSIFRIILSPVFLIFYLNDDPFSKRVSLIIFFIAVLTDWYDGWHARKYKSVTNFGIFIDPLADKVLTSFAFYLFYLLGFMPLWMLIIIVLRDIFVTVIRSYDEYNGLIMKTSIIAKTKTFIQMTYLFLILSLLILITYPIGEPNISLINDFIFKSQINYYLLLLVTGLTLYTGIDYLLKKRYVAKNEIN
jgi:CDP-diacylglycerol--glycerol-3-phosphate 3-phosphatidyltransferase